jgi:hypothetical protein
MDPATTDDAFRDNVVAAVMNDTPIRRYLDPIFTLLN